MKRIHYPLIALALFFLSSCQKELSLEHADLNEVKAKQFQEFIVSKKFQLKAFYADIPIDFIETDVAVKQETDLWWYVSSYIKDDANVFTTAQTTFTVEQNALKMPGVSDSVLVRQYHIGKDEDGVYVEFLDNQYQPLTYRLYKTGPDYFILSIKWKYGATLYSRFELID